MKFCDFVDWI